MCGTTRDFNLQPTFVTSHHCHLTIVHLSKDQGGVGGGVLDEEDFNRVHDTKFVLKYSSHSNSYLRCKIRRSTELDTFLGHPVF